MQLPLLITAAALVGSAVLYFRSVKGSKSEDDGGEDIRNHTYSGFRTTQLTTGPDRGAGISAIGQNSAGSPVQAGRQNYRIGNTVLCNSAYQFGSKSYRHSMCLPDVSTIPQEPGIDSAMFGVGRHQSAGNPGDWAWDNARFMDGIGWQNNGAAIVARSWSCKAANTQGPNNINCRRNRSPQALNLGKLAGGLGFFPYSTNSDVRSRWLDSTGNGVPLVSYNSDPQKNGSRQYSGLQANRTSPKQGFIDDSGAVWIMNSDSVNFSQISDENPDVLYFVAMVGARGRRAAMNRVTGQNVPVAQWRPRWKDLTNIESMQFVSTGGSYSWKVDPWSIPGSPWHTLDMMESKVWNSQNSEFILDYRKGPTSGFSLNNSFQSAMRESGRFGDIRSLIGGRRWVAYKNMAVPRGVGNWPIVNYGVTYPWRQANVPNGFPYDFAMPVFTNFWADMPVDETVF